MEAVFELNPKDKLEFDNRREKKKRILSKRNTVWKGMGVWKYTWIKMTAKISLELDHRYSKGRGIAEVKGIRQGYLVRGLE